MSILKIAKFGHPILLKKTQEVKDIGSEKIKKIIYDMSETMLDYNGVGLAAPQVHISKRIIKPFPITKKGANAGNWCYLLNVKNVSTLLEVLKPYDNRISIDVIMRNNIEKLKILFSKYNHAIHYEKNYSLRKDLNLQNKNLLQIIKFTFRKYFKN